MRQKIHYVLASFVVMFFLSAGAMAADAEPTESSVRERTLVMGSGSISGTYYPVAGAICRLVNKERERHGLRCLVEAGGSSATNLQGLRDGTLDLAIVQSMAQYQAYKGEGAFKEVGAFPGLRALMSLHGEAVILIAAKDAPIKTIEDLPGKRVNLGHPGSFQRTMADLVVGAFGWTEKSFSHALEIEPGELGKALCDGQVDAVFLTGVQPQEEVQSMLKECGARILEVKGKQIDTLLEKHSYLAVQTIPGAQYAGQTDDVATIGVLSTLMTTDKLPENAGYEIIKAVIENFEPLTGMHLVLATLEQENIGKIGLSAPLHEGASRYFKEMAGPQE